MKILSFFRIFRKREHGSNHLATYGMTRSEQYLGNTELHVDLSSGGARTLLVAGSWS
jgi:hypothetical protein